MDDDILTDIDRARYQWQLWVNGFGEEGQARLKRARVLVSRCGGVGSVVAYQLAAAGVGTLVLAHAGNLRIDDLNRQLLMHHAGIGKPRVEQAAQKLQAFNPDLAIETVAENISETNVDRIVAGVDAVASCAPLFEERLLMNRAAIRHNKPLVDCAMYEMEAQLTTIVPGKTPCLACLYPQAPPTWRREFPVFGAVSGSIAAMGAIEMIKVLGQFATPLLGQMLVCDFATMDFRKVRLERNPACTVCAS